MGGLTCLVSELQSCLQQSLSKKWQDCNVSWWGCFEFAKKKCKLLFSFHRSWVCVKLVSLLSKWVRITSVLDCAACVMHTILYCSYPSGVTRAIAMAELDNEVKLYVWSQLHIHNSSFTIFICQFMQFQKSGGKLVQIYSQQQKS